MLRSGAARLVAGGLLIVGAPGLLFTAAVAASMFVPLGFWNVAAGELTLPFGSTLRVTPFLGTAAPLLGPM